MNDPIAKLMNVLKNIYERFVEGHAELYYLRDASRTSSWSECPEAAKERYRARAKQDFEALIPSVDYSHLGKRRGRARR
jgi:hypothetical protein